MGLLSVSISSFHRPKIPLYIQLIGLKPRLSETIRCFSTIDRQVTTQSLATPTTVRQRQQSARHHANLHDESGTYRLYEIEGDTTDPDRKITHLKADMGDGTITEWLPVETPDTSVTLDVSHVYSSRPSGGTYDIKVYARDDNNNESNFVLTPNDFIRVTIVAGEPVAVVRAVPSMVRAGQAIRFDGSDSYAIDTGATIADFFTFGDGSTGVNGTSVFQDHTFAQAGEFMATLIVTDSAGSVSPVAKAIVKVLPATLVVPLTLSTKPSSFSRTRTASLTSTPILDAVYPEITDMGQRADEFSMTGMFLRNTGDRHSVHGGTAVVRCIGRV